MLSLWPNLSPIAPERIIGQLKRHQIIHRSLTLSQFSEMSTAPQTGTRSLYAMKLVQIC